MAGTLKVTFWISLACLLASCWQYDTFSDDLRPLPALDAPPKQGPTREPPFRVDSNGVSYAIRPLHAYELYGRVVSMRHHDGDYMVHRLWNDHLNVADLCVIWGRNAAELDLQQFRFRNGEFTCFVETDSRAAWQTFAMDGLANNHLLADQPHIREAIRSARIGDQIHLTGWLAEYANADGFHRGSSTSRDDTGNGACETIYVRSFRVVEPMPSLWRSMYPVAAVVAPVSALLWLIGVLRGRF